MAIKRIWATLTFALLAVAATAQFDPAVDSIIKEGKLLYRLEMANWNGSDLFKTHFPELQQRTGGYFSYTYKNHIKCIFYSGGTSPKVLVSITFDSTFNTYTAAIDSVQRSLQPMEAELYKLRQTALKLIAADTLFKVYPNSTLNLIPLFAKDNQRVFVLTAPKDPGTILFGNDYLIQFDNDGNVSAKETFHTGVYRFQNTKSDEVSLHFHPEGGQEYITATDICTLLLYERYTSWKQHVVISEHKVSIWNTGNEELTVIPRSVWDKMMEERQQANH